METYFICLANSRKLSGRCLAGIQVNAKVNIDGKISVQPIIVTKWIRPVFEADHGQLPNGLVARIKLLDLVSIDITEAVPEGFQSENVHFVHSSIKVLGNIGLNQDNINKLIRKDYEYIFGNNKKFLDAAEIVNINHSLLLIKVHTPQFISSTSMNGSIQIRVRFEYKSHTYDLPITDLVFNGIFQTKEETLKDISCFYFTISLGVKFNELYYKLVAGILAIV